MRGRLEESDGRFKLTTLDPIDFQLRWGDGRETFAEGGTGYWTFERAIDARRFAEKKGIAIIEPEAA